MRYEKDEGERVGEEEREGEGRERHTGSLSSTVFFSPSSPEEKKTLMVCSPHKQMRNDNHRVFTHTHTHTHTHSERKCVRVSE